MVERVRHLGDLSFVVGPFLHPSRLSEKRSGNSNERDQAGREHEGQAGLGDVDLSGTDFS